MLPRKHWKPFLKRNLPCREKQVTCQGFLRISGLIQCQPLRQEREKSMWQMKKDKNTPAKQFRGSNFNEFLNASCVHHNDEKCQLPTNTQQCSPAISMHYGIDQTTAQRFNNEAACNFPNHEQPLLSCVLNWTVTFKGSSVIDDNDLQSLYGQKTQDKDNYLTNVVIEAYLQLIASKGMLQGTKVGFLRWESLEKGFSTRVLERKSTFNGTRHCSGSLYPWPEQALVPSCCSPKGKTNSCLG